VRGLFFGEAPMGNCIRRWSAAALLAITLPAQAAGPAPEPKAEPAGAPVLPNVRDSLLWPPELAEGRRAWSLTALSLNDEFTGKPGRAKVPANAELRLARRKTLNDTEWWVVEAVASKAKGLARADALTRTWPKGDADTLAPMLGDRSAEIERMQFLLSSQSFRARLDVYQQLHRYSGITDESLFDTLAVRLIQGLDQSDTANAFWKTLWKDTLWGAQFARAISIPASGGGVPFNLRDWANEVVWLTRALASSGYSKYRPLLERAAESDARKVARYANAALDELEDFARWNRIINDPSNYKPGQSHESARLLNMVRSGEPRLQSVGLNRIEELDRQPTAHATVPAAQPDASPWETKFEVGRRARVLAEVRLRRAPAGEAHFATLAAGATVGLKGKRDLEGTEWWEVLPVASRNRQTGWVPRTELTQHWPAGPADRLGPMLGDRGAEVDTLIKRLRDGDTRVRILAVQGLYLSGITDERVFDTIAQVLAAGLAQGSQVESTRSLWAGISAGLLLGPAGQAAAATPPINQRTWPQEPAWLAKGLSYSGYTKYRPLLELAAESDAPGSSSLSDHAGAALENLEQHAYWNHVINDPRNARPGRSEEVARTLNMLQSGERELVRGGVNQAARLSAQWPELNDAIEAELLKSYALELHDAAEDIAAMMAKALVGTRDPKYQATLAKVAHNTPSEKLRRHANAGLPAAKKARPR
jgi:hypothetical protein